MTADGSLTVTDVGNSRLCIFGLDGRLIRETLIKAGMIRQIIPLSNGDHIVFTGAPIDDPRSDYQFQYIVNICGPDFQTKREMDRISIENIEKSKKLKATYHLFSWDISGKTIATAYQERGYEIRVFDLEGKAVRVIKKEYKKIPVPGVYKKTFSRILSGGSIKLNFPDTMPPFENMFADEEGRIFVMTYEPGSRENERMCDVFNPDGVFVSRISLPAPKDYLPSTTRTQAINGRIYCLREKESGGEELVVFRMNWK